MIVAAWPRSPRRAARARGFAMSDIAADLAARFQAAADASKQLPKRPDNDTLLEIYALFKQATAGDVSGPAPGPFDFVGRAKYDAWTGLRGTAKEEAMRRYVELIERLKG
jgi:acyl-CoA-binding protein